MDKQKISLEQIEMSQNISLQSSQDNISLPSSSNTNNLEEINKAKSEVDRWGN